MIGSINSSIIAATANTQAQRDEESRILARKSKDIEEVAEQNRVAQIKEAIENKDYKIDLRKTSEKMALDLLNV
ncbi:MULTISPECIES: flagellar biosynthesis anti-sigma factor FlgM [Helicobacter]|uniref:Flagellar anti FliA (Sigma 28) factor n=2 Tax=Helicobacter TaxID=209 RepID=A0A377J692_9HELI|nr:MULTISPECIES: flagellar biosynthesis anti-sigma factor FlgM [Helicobacter]MDL0080126.1 flagellar biosynthesis anti-sigma factor FlgM [Helicobacter sp. CPD2-1]MDL0081915.1 flagellar biosynthesis anti-sigma factor FlgM [Helicobacter sp. XJK30-2]STO98017.1 flagellar anti FliA (sigma 28) factor [Helicobacter canis]